MLFNDNRLCENIKNWRTPCTAVMDLVLAVTYVIKIVCLKKKQNIYWLFGKWKNKQILYVELL